MYRQQLPNANARGLEGRPIEKRISRLLVQGLRIRVNVHGQSHRANKPREVRIRL